jgi:hypothetical protein
VGKKAQVGDDEYEEEEEEEEEEKEGSEEDEKEDEEEDEDNTDEGGEEDEEEDDEVNDKEEDEEEKEEDDPEEEDKDLPIPPKRLSSINKLRQHIFFDEDSVDDDEPVLGSILPAPSAASPANAESTSPHETVIPVKPRVSSRKPVRAKKDAGKRVKFQCTLLCLASTK